MKSLGTRIKEARKNCGLKQSDIANALNIKNTTVSNWEKDISKPDLDTIEYLCGLFKVSADYFFDGTASKEILSFNEKEHIKKYRNLDDYGKKAVEQILNIEYERTQDQLLKEKPQETEHAYLLHENRLYMTSYDCGASAGTGNFLDEWDIPKSMISVPDTPETRKADFILRVTGDSMEPSYFDGDHVLVKAQDNVNMNDIAIYIIDGESYIKQYKGSYLHSLNPAYEDIPMNNDQYIKCVGKVLGSL